MDVSSLKKILKTNHCRVTNARLEIFELLYKNDSSLSAKDVFDKLKPNSTTDLVSVYRNLTLFNELGIVHKFQDGTFSACKQSHRHTEQESHVHFINLCVECGQKSEIHKHSTSHCELARELKKVSKPLKTLHEVIIQGLCPECS